MKLLIDTTSYCEKPKGYEIGKISNRIIKKSVEVNVEELAKEIGKGKTFVPATFREIQGQLRRSNENWESQQVIALDFDEGLRLEEAYNDQFFQENAVFLYTTFSHTEEKHKFRVVFVLDEPLYEYKHFQAIINDLLTRYPYADKSCKDGSRLFYGGKKVVPFNYENRLLLSDFKLQTPLQDIEYNLNNMSRNRVPPTQLVSRPTNVQLILERDVRKLQQRLKVKPVALTSNEVINYLKNQDLRNFLGVKKTGNFIDIFHEENEPSSSIFKSKSGSGHWLYKCFSANHQFAGTILHIVQKLLSCSSVEAKRFLMEVYMVTIYESEAVKEFKESIDIYKELLRSEDLEEIHPYFYKVFSRYGHLQDLYTLLDLTKEYITGDSDPRIVFYHSIRTLAKHFGRSVPATGTRLNFLSLFNVTRKLNEAEIPDDLLSYQKNSKRVNHYQYRSSTYELPMYTYDFFCEIDDMCKLWLEKGCTSRTISYEGIMRTFGREEADRVYPQDKGKEIPKLNEDIASDIHHLVLNQIEAKGWTTEKEVLECLDYKFKGQDEFKHNQFKRCIGEMLDAYNLEIISTNKKIKEEMKITEEFMNKHSFPKIIKYR
ncbi:hypothetical protein [Bacillus sp. NTK034]|uniref:hypothetical protein n=1 Tax=Bacillus sp. NTK034 TaxID=2802176 RepID=UPI001A8C8CFF|nr:hypothetical protein [Bacillus sp. NTK034]MBN8199179.1 hypothetical protein [Bacillus sp. NTK034]